MKRVLLLLGCMWVLEGPAQVLKIWTEVPLTKKQKRSEMTVYLPDPGKNTGISVIICPGGSYCYLGIHREGHQVAKWLKSKGIAAFVLRYRVGMYGNHYPAMIQDLQRAIQWVRMHGKEYRIHPDRVGVMGFSAGGHLAGTAGIYYEENFMEPLGIRPEVSLRPDFVAMIYPVVSMQDSIVHRKSRRNLLGRHFIPELAEKMSLEKNVHPGMPPVFLVHCRDDKTVDVRNSEVLARKLEEKGCVYRAFFYRQGNHGFGISPKRKADAGHWPENFEKWLHQITKEINK